MIGTVVVCIVLMYAPAREVVTQPEARIDEHLDVSLLPVLAYDPDDGFGAGATGGLYWLREGFAPYKYGLEWELYITTRNAHWDFVQFDWLRVNDTPWRLMAVGVFYATRTDMYCGLGNSVQCTDARAAAAAAANGLTGAARDTFIEDYFYRRYLAPSAELKAFYPFFTAPVKFEGMLYWRGTYYIPGEIDDLSVYPGSLYAGSYPHGEPGMVSLLQAGLTVDHRDNEPAPTQGYWCDVSVRAALPVFGSKWTFGGANLTAREYLPVTADHKLVWANRTIADFMIGEPPVVELSQFGTYSLVPGGLQGFGGGDVGRGINQDTFLGRIKVTHQSELRWTFLDFDILGEKFDLGALLFTDLAYVAVDYDNFAGNPAKINAAEGAGLRLAWDKNFIVRFDLGVSSAEEFAVYPYLDINNTF